MNLSKSHWFKGLVVVALLLATILSGTGHLDSLIDKWGVSQITDSNEAYLNASFKRSMHGFLILSAIKSGVAVIEGSEIGIGFNLEVGDIAQSVYDYVDVAWKTALAGSTVLLLMRVTLKAIQQVDQWALFIMLLTALTLTLFSYFLPEQAQKRHILKECLFFSCILVAALYLILPISISGAAFLSRQITSPLVEEAQEGFESFQEDLSPAALNQRFFPDSQEEDSFWSRLDFSAKLQNSREALMKMAQYLKQITNDFAVWTVMLIAGYLFDCIIFPLAFFLVMYIFIKGAMKYLIGNRREYAIRKEVRMLLDGYAVGK